MVRVIQRMLCSVSYVWATLCCCQCYTMFFNSGVSADENAYMHMKTCICMQKRVHVYENAHRYMKRMYVYEAYACI